jgi:hypothetical protein
MCVDTSTHVATISAKRCPTIQASKLTLGTVLPPFQDIDWSDVHSCGFWYHHVSANHLILRSHTVVTLG